MTSVDSHAISGHWSQDRSVHIRALSHLIQMSRKTDVFPPRLISIHFFLGGKQLFLWIGDHLSNPSCLMQALCCHMCRASSLIAARRITSRPAVNPQYSSWSSTCNKYTSLDIDESFISPTSLGLDSGSVSLHPGNAAILARFMMYTMVLFDFASTPWKKISKPRVL